MEWFFPPCSMCSETWSDLGCLQNHLKTPPLSSFPETHTFISENIFPNHTLRPWWVTWASPRCAVHHVSSWFSSCTFKLKCSCCQRYPHFATLSTLIASMSCDLQQLLLLLVVATITVLLLFSGQSWKTSAIMQPSLPGKHPCPSHSIPRAGYI